MEDEKIRLTIDQNEIDTTGKIIAGIILISFLVLPIIFIVGIWPNRMPAPADVQQLYLRDLFNMRLLEERKPLPPRYIHINSIMFLLVALSGFLGSMIHLATSFTNYVGSGKFKSSWVLWYVVKPFTGAAVALVFYLVLRAGLLNFDGGGGANPYAIVILSALAGLFTDKATLKLEEIFEVIFKPKDVRPDKIDETSIKISGFDPKKLIVDADNNITITGQGFDKHAVSVKINDTEVPILDKKPNAVSFKFKIPDQLKAEKSLKLTVLNDAGKSIYDGEFELTGGEALELKKEGATAAVDQEGELIIGDEAEVADEVEFVKG